MNTVKEGFYCPNPNCGKQWDGEKCNHCGYSKKKPLND